MSSSFVGVGGLGPSLDIRSGMGRMGWDGMRSPFRSSTLAPRLLFGAVLDAGGIQFIYI